jgi:hypothetical protein
MRRTNWEIVDSKDPICIVVDGSVIDLHNDYALEEVQVAVTHEEVRAIWRRVADASPGPGPAVVRMLFTEVKDTAIWPRVFPAEHEGDTLELMIGAGPCRMGTLTHPAGRRTEIGKSDASLVFVMMDGRAIEVSAGASTVELEG